MAVYTQLDERFLQTLLSLYTVGELVSFEGIAAGSINTSYRLVTTQGTYFLRVNEGKSFEDVLYEKDLLVHLQGRAASLHQVKTPHIVQNNIHGSFFPVTAQKQAALFPKLEGRELAIFELKETHLEQLGRFIARAHHALRDFRHGRANPYGLPVVTRWLRDMRARPEARDVLTIIEPAFARVARLRRRRLPRGVVHGDLFLDNTKWRHDELIGVFDWEMAGRDHMALDLAVAINAWCWVREDQAFRPPLVQALLRGYAAVRPLTPVERRGLYGEACFAALRFTMSRIRDFELPRPGVSSSTERLYLDYRDFAARMQALFLLGPRGFAALAGGFADSGRSSR